MGKKLKGVTSMKRSADETLLARIIGKHKKEFESESKKNEINSIMRTMELKTIIPIEACTLVEALANLYLSLKCDAGLFGSLEKVSLLEKWYSIPRLFNSKYKLVKSSVLYRNLRELIRTRNSIIHHKPVIVKNGVVVHKGNYPKKPNNEYELIIAFTQIPIKLLENLEKYDDCMSLDIHTIRVAINS